jgi:oligopeptide/dipeptide ABC transporter ATP-binding protein
MSGRAVAMADRQPGPADRPLLRVENLAVEFGSREKPIRVVDAVSFEVTAGSAVGIVGESGSGKSMTSLAIMGLISDTPGRIVEGKVELEGTSLLDLPRSSMADIRGRDIAMIFQEPMSSLNPVMTIGDQIGEAIKLHQELGRAERRQRVIELLKLVGIPNPEGRLGAYPHQFSGGMRQRVMIAMAVACDPRLLIADEPTTALDVTIQAQVLDLMHKVRRTLNTAILLISHDLGVIADVCERVIVMYAGRVVEEADVRSIFRSPRHPYTRALLRSIPRLSDGQSRLYQIPGSVPLPGTIKEGCPFYARCPDRVDKCARDLPPLFDVGAGQRAACWVSAGAAS